MLVLLLFIFVMMAMVILYLASEAIIAGMRPGIGTKAAAD
jgi:hypothetical protein